MKEVGRYQKNQILDGLEGYVMYALNLFDFGSEELTSFKFMQAKFGEPKPWSQEEVHVWIAKIRIREEFANPKLHSYVYRRRVW